jgi:hypothetical protein
MKRASRLFALSLLCVLCLSSPAAAATNPGPVLFGGYWHSFIEFWQGFLQKQNGVVMAVLGLGAVALLIITRSGNWKK